MGAWGPRSFGNDCAHDWLAELDGIRSLRAPLARVIKRTTTACIAVDDASAVIAAAEAKLVGERDDTWDLTRRTVAIRYVTT